MPTYQVQERNQEGRVTETLVEAENLLELAALMNFPNTVEWRATGAREFTGKRGKTDRYVITWSEGDA